MNNTGKLNYLSQNCNCKYKYKSGEKLIFKKIENTSQKTDEKHVEMNGKKDEIIKQRYT